MKHRTLRFGFALAVALTTSLAVAQTKRPAPPATQPQKQQAVEVTKEDFLTMPKVVSSDLSTFGVRLGMTRQEAIGAVKSFCPQCSIGSYNEPCNCVGIPGNAVLYFEEGEVNKIEWPQEMEKYLVGQSRKLLTPAAFTKDSAIRLELLGREDNMTIEPSGSPGAWAELMQTFVYGKEGLRLVSKVLDFGPTPGHPENTHEVLLHIYLTKPAKVR